MIIGRMIIGFNLSKQNLVHKVAQPIELFCTETSGGMKRRWVGFAAAKQRPWRRERRRGGSQSSLPDLSWPSSFATRPGKFSHLLMGGILCSAGDILHEEGKINHSIYKVGLMNHPTCFLGWIVHLTDPSCEVYNSKSQMMYPAYESWIIRIHCISNKLNIMCPF